MYTTDRGGLEVSKFVEESYSNYHTFRKLGAQHKNGGQSMVCSRLVRNRVLILAILVSNRVWFLHSS